MLATRWGKREKCLIRPKAIEWWSYQVGLFGPGIRFAHSQKLGPRQILHLRASSSWWNQWSFLQIFLPCEYSFHLKTKIENFGLLGFIHLPKTKGGLFERDESITVVKRYRERGDRVNTAKGLAVELSFGKFCGMIKFFWQKALRHDKKAVRRRVELNARKKCIIGPTLTGPWRGIGWNYTVYPK